MTCTDLDCSENCCNYYGTCPDSQSTDSLTNSCFTNYETDTFPFWIIGPIVFGVCFIMMIACCCYAKRKQNQMLAGGQQTVVVNQNQDYPQPFPYNQGGQDYNLGYQGNQQYNGYQGNQQYNQPYLGNQLINHPQQQNGFFGTSPVGMQQQQPPIYYG